MKNTFEEFVWAYVENDRPTTIVVDNLHAYGIIRNRVDSLWEQIRLLDPEEDQTMILGGFVALAAYCQLCAESLMLVPEQLAHDDRSKVAEDQAVTARNNLRNLAVTLLRKKQAIASLQKGSKRYSFEFGEHFIEGLKQVIEENE